MTKLVECGDYRCRHYNDHKCQLEEIHLILSYGRSTDFVETLICKEKDPL